MAQDGAGHFAEKRLDDVNPGAVFGSQYVLEPVRVGCQKGPRLF